MGLPLMLALAGQDDLRYVGRKVGEAERQPLSSKRRHSFSLLNHRR